MAESMVIPGWSMGKYIPERSRDLESRWRFGTHQASVFRDDNAALCSGQQSFGDATRSMAKSFFVNVSNKISPRSVVNGNFFAMARNFRVSP